MNGQRHTNKICLLGAGEASTYGVIAGGIETSTYYNNHDISFHNMIWATAMQGGCTTGQDWQWPIIHRWRDANPPAPEFPFGKEINDQFIFTFSNPALNLSGDIKPLYDNYTPLSNFLSQSGIDFNENLTPVGDLIANDNIEYYMLLKSDKTDAYGWVHNLNRYWGNNYYYTASLQNYYGCDPLPLPATSVLLDHGFTPNATYQFMFYQTQNGTQPLPNDYVQLATADGKLTLDLSSLPLDCNILRSDYAFRIEKIPPAAQRMSNTIQTVAPPIRDFTFTVFPNPNYGVFILAINNSFKDENATIKILDLTGRVIYKIKLINSNNQALNLNQIAKGCYYIQLQISSITKIQKLIIQ